METPLSARAVVPHTVSRTIPHALFLVTLTLGALFLPVPLYLVSLALFGLPHVIWEMAFLRSRYGTRWPAMWWRALWLVLLVQAALRTAVWYGTYPAALSAITDLLALLLLGAIVLLAPRGTGWRARLSGAMLAGVMFWLLERGEVLGALLILALLHNLTPLALAWDLAREHRQARRLAWTISALFVLPLLIAASGWQGSTALLLNSHGRLLDGQLPGTWSGAFRPALLSAVVLAQCLHYYCVIVLLPQAERARTARDVLPAPLRNVALAAAGLLAIYFVSDYQNARALYAVAAGAHAWLEWPVLLMALLGPAADPSVVHADARRHSN
ncbi:MAG TPA: hypothetical protein VM512_05725 [Burkholderiaceae bacterium]|nr:hypothetical protein [Burkholderiaceae bacterium]